MCLVEKFRVRTLKYKNDMLGPMFKIKEDQIRTVKFIWGKTMMQVNVKRLIHLSY